jgi:hypothetical protein
MYDELWYKERKKFGDEKLSVHRDILSRAMHEMNDPMTSAKHEQPTMAVFGGSSLPHMWVMRGRGKLVGTIPEKWNCQAELAKGCANHPGNLVSVVERLEPPVTAEWLL